MLSNARVRWRTIRYWIREFLGENDYERYVAEWHARHSATSDSEHDGSETGHRLLTPREFFRERCAVKYGSGVQRCC